MRPNRMQGRCPMGFLNPFITLRALAFEAWGPQSHEAVMRNIPIAFYVVGALFTLYVVAATWRAKDASSRVQSDTRRQRSRPVSVDRRLNHWWRARQSLKKTT